LIQDLAEITLFKDIPKDRLEEFRPLFKLRRFNKNHILIYEDDPGDEVYFIRSGMVKVYRMKEAQEIVFNFHFPGNAVGELEAICEAKRLPRMASVEAFEPVTAWMLAKQDLLSIIDKHPVVLRRAYNLLVERLVIMNRKLRSLTFDDTRTRTADMIMDLYHNFGVAEEGAHRIEFKITQSLLADMLGLTRESVSKVLGEFKKEGVISIEHKTIHILNLPQLERMCQEPNEAAVQRVWHER
jgi:CRP/FNR family transcriptional regulator